MAVMYTVSSYCWNSIYLLEMLIICKLIRQTSYFYLSKRKQAKSSSCIIPILFSSTKSTCKTTPDSFNYSAFCLTCISLLLCMPIPQQQLRARSTNWFWKVRPTTSLTCRITLDSGFCFFFYYVYICVCVFYIYLTSVVKLVFIL